MQLGPLRAAAILDVLEAHKRNVRDLLRATEPTSKTPRPIIYAISVHTLELFVEGQLMRASVLNAFFGPEQTKVSIGDHYFLDERGYAAYQKALQA